MTTPEVPMTTQEVIALWVQVAAVVAAVAAAIVALAVSAKDRANARRIAAEDRRTALLMFQLEALTKLSQNLRRGGHTDPDAIKDMGAEAGALIGAIGPERLPRNWDRRVAQTEEELLKFADDEAKPGWLRRSVEAQIALMAVSKELQGLFTAEAEAAQKDTPANT